MMLNDNVMEVFDKYYPETQTDETLMNRLENDPEAVVMLLKASRAKEESLSVPDLPDTQRKTLSSAQNVLKLYDNYIKPAAQSFNEAVTNEDTEKLMPMMENPLYQNSFIYAGNDFISNNPGKDEVEQLYNTGSLSSLQPIMESAEKLQGDMTVQAHFYYGKNIDPKFSEKSEKEQQAIHAYIDEHPREVTALALTFEKNRESALPAKVFNATDLQAKCKLPEIQQVAAGISFIDREESLKTTIKQIKPLSGLDKQHSTASKEQKSFLSAKHTERCA